LQQAAVPEELDLESIGASSSTTWAMILKKSLQHPNKCDTPLQTSHVSPLQKRQPLGKNDRKLDDGRGTFSSI
jgi:hypothetical protein